MTLHAIFRWLLRQKTAFLASSVATCLLIHTTAASRASEIWSDTFAAEGPLPGVVISEFMADNTAGIQDEDGNRSDWIELHNASSEPVDLRDWFLTDDPNQLAKWRFPAWVLAPNSYLLVWASEKNRRDAGHPLHTSFKLSALGEYLALVSPQTNVVSEFAPVYPPQEPNVSYGRDRVEPSLTGYFAAPTPGKPNSTTGLGFASEAIFSLPGGIYTDGSLTVALSAAAGEIRYTLDGSIPTEASPRYSQPLTFSVSTIVQARVFQAGLLPSPIVFQVYNLVGGGLEEFSSNLPILIINTAGRGIPMDQRVRAFISTLEPHDGRARFSQTPDFESAASVEVRGQTSSGFPKQPYNLEINDLSGHDREVPLLGLPAESDWVLHNPYTDKCLMNNVLAFELHRKMGHYAPRCQFVEVFVKTTRSRLSYPADYRGVYVLMEKIKIDKNRVDITPLTPAHNQEPEITGGYMIKKDKDSPGDLNFFTQGGGGFSGQYLKIHEPKPREITPAQLDWIAGYLNQFERNLYASDWLRRTGANHYSHYIDVDSFVDNHWIVEFSKQIDGYRLSNYLSKDRGGKLKMEPIWDWNLAFGNADYHQGWMTNGWYYPLIDDFGHLWLRRLISGTPNGSQTRGDPDFNQKITDRWSVLRTNILSAETVTRRIDEIAAYLDEAQQRDFAKYPRLNSYVWPNPSFYIAPTYAHIIDAMKRWVRGRFDWIDRQFIKAPRFSHPGGLLDPGFPLTFSTDTGTILFTLDGSDPRLPGGAVSPVARTYAASPIPLDQNVRVFARTRSGTNWSGPALGTFIVQIPPLVITELMPQPLAPPSGDTNSAENFEFIELKNVGPAELDLRGVRFTRGIEYTFSDTSALTRLAPGAHVLLVKNRAAFASRYPAAVDVIAGEYSGNLDNAGERLTLEGPLLETILDFRYENSWLPITRGHGFSLVIVNDRAPFDSWGVAGSWRASSHPGGSPGQDDPAPLPIARVVVNEILSRPEPPQQDAIELFNPGPSPASIGGWFLTDNFDVPGKFRVPDGTVVQAESFVVFDRTDFQGDSSTGFALGAAGDEVYLFSGDGRELTGYVHGFSFGAAAAGVSFGRLRTSTGSEHLVALTAVTLGSPNAAPRVGPVVINEIMFQPPPEGGTNNNTADEYIELLNITDQPVPLFHSGSPVDAWQISGGVTFTFPPQTTLPAGSLGLIVNFNPADAAALARFRAKYSVAASVPIFGPFGGNLDNRGERLSLSRPELFAATAAGASNVVQNVLVDQVRYNSAAPWPLGAAGTGQSLQRILSPAYGDDPVNWMADTPSPGQLNAGVNADTDADGLPDPWELVHFGNLNNGPDEDFDGDGLTNMQEFLAGTDPTDPARLLALAPVWLAQGQIGLHFEAAAGRNYSIMTASELSGAWQKLEDIPAQPLSGPRTVAIEPLGQCRFYRVVLTPP